jgi:hypothetical protein
MTLEQHEYAGELLSHRDEALRFSEMHYEQTKGFMCKHIPGTLSATLTKADYYKRLAGKYEKEYKQFILDNL